MSQRWVRAMFKLLSLKVLDLFKPLFRGLKVDYDKLRAILKAKLIMENRRTSAFSNSFSGQESKSKVSEFFQNNSFFKKGYILFLIYGLILGGLCFSIDDVKTRYTVLFAVGIFLFFAGIVVDFTEVLIDTRDRDILLYKPVGEREVNLARLISLIIYIVKLSLIMFGPALLITLVKRPQEFFILLLEVIMLSISLVMFEYIFYYVLFKIFKNLNIKSIITTVQVLIFVIIMVGFQIIANAIDKETALRVFTSESFKYLFIPMWFTGPFELLYGNFDTINIIYTVLLIVLFVALIAINTAISKDFEEILSKKDKVIINKKSSFLQRLTNKFFAKNDMEKAGVNMVFWMKGSDEKLKFQLGSLSLMIIVYPLIFYFAMFKKGSDPMAETALKDHARFVTLINYMSAMMAMSIWQILNYATNYKASIIHLITGNLRLKEYRNGVKKGGLFAFIFVPILINAMIMSLFIRDAWFIDYVNPIIFIMLSAIIASDLMLKNIPFSMDVAKIKNGQKGYFWAGMAAMLITAVLTGLNALFIFLNTPFIYLYTLIGLGALIYLLKK